MTELSIGPATGLETGLGTDSSIRAHDEITKDGILYKKRDHFNEYPPRYFILKNSIFSYHRDYNGPPIRSIVLDKNIIIKYDEKPTPVPSLSAPLYLFQIYQKNISMQLQLIYILGTKTELERRSWIQEIEQITKKTKNLQKKLVFNEEDTGTGSDRGTGTGTGKKKGNEEEEVKEKDEAMNSTNSLISSIVEPENPEATYSNLSDPMRKKIDSIAYALLTLSNELPLPDPTPSTPSTSTSTSSEWSLIYEKNNILGYRKTGSGVVCVRGETIFPYTIPEICSLTNQWTSEIEPNLDTYKRLSWLSKHTGVEHIKYKAVWPTLPRDFVNMTHWRVLKQDPHRLIHPQANDTERDSSYFLTFSFSEKSVGEQYCPPIEGYVRGDVLVGYVMKHVTGGTKVIFIIQVSLDLSVSLS
jgi:hypothetical protein